MDHLASAEVSNDEGLFRPAHMSLIQLYIPIEVAQNTIAELGQLGICQFKDVFCHNLRP